MQDSHKRTGMIIDGRSIGVEVIAELRERRSRINRTITLGIVVSPGDPVIESFVRIKSRLAEELDVRIVRIDIAEPTTEAAMNAVRALKYYTSIDGMIVQLPMPETVDVNAVLSEVPMEKDIDGINPFTRESERLVRAPVALAVQEILQRAHVSLHGARAVVVGAGRLVGVPTAALLREQGAEVTIFTLNEGSIEDLKVADIVVAGAGQPHFIKPEHVKNGVVLIDAGTSEIAGVIQGDVDPACREIAGVFTPVPGGVGPIAVAMIFRNILDLTTKRYAQ